MRRFVMGGSGGGKSSPNIFFSLKRPPANVTSFTSHFFSSRSMSFSSFCSNCSQSSPMKLAAATKKFSSSLYNQSLVRSPLSFPLLRSPLPLNLTEVGRTRGLFTSRFRPRRPSSFPTSTTPKIPKISIPRITQTAKSLPKNVTTTKGARGAKLSRRRGKTRRKQTSLPIDYSSRFVSYFKALGGHHRDRVVPFFVKILDLLRSFRTLLTGNKPWTLDRLYGLFSLIALGTTTWIVVGTTTAMSAVIVLANTLRFQHLLVDKISKIVTKQTGFKVEFEHADVASWGDSAICLKNVTVTREGNEGCSAINLKIEELQVKISIRKHLEGSGILSECSVRCVRGCVDSGMVAYDPPLPYSKPTWSFGDFDLDRLESEDVQIDFLMPWYNRPLSLNLFQFKSGRIRRQWFLFDLFTADYIRGTIDNCLFNFQRISEEGTEAEVKKGRRSWWRRFFPEDTWDEDEEENVDHVSENFSSSSSSNSNNNVGERRVTNHFKLDGLPIEFLTSGSTGPLGWLTSGYIDLEMYSKFPMTHKNQSSSLSPQVDVPEKIPIHCSINLKHLTARVPVVSPDLTYMSSALIRPVVAFINTNYTQIPLNFDFKLNLQNFDGAWYPQDANLWVALSDGVGRSIAHRVEEQKKPRRIRELVAIGVDGVFRGIAHMFYCAVELYL